MWEAKLWPVLSLDILKGREVNWQQNIQGAQISPRILPRSPPLRRRKKRSKVFKTSTEGYDPRNPNKTNYTNFSSIKRPETGEVNIECHEVKRVEPNSPRLQPVLFDLHELDELNCTSRSEVLDEWGTGFESDLGLDQAERRDILNNFERRKPSSIIRRVTPPFFKGHHHFRKQRNPPKKNRAAIVQSHTHSRIPPPIITLCNNRFHAVLIGVSAYSDSRIKPEERILGDIEKLQDQLECLGYTVDVLTDTTAPPTKDNVLLFVKDALAKTPPPDPTGRPDNVDLEPTPSLLIYFAGRVRKLDFENGREKLVLFCEDTGLYEPLEDCLTLDDLLLTDRNGTVGRVFIDGYPLLGTKPKSRCMTELQPDSYFINTRTTHGYVLIKGPGQGGNFECCINQRQRESLENQGGLLSSYMHAVLSGTEISDPRLGVNAVNVYLMRKFNKLGFNPITTASSLNKEQHVLCGLEHHAALRRKAEADSNKQLLKRNQNKSWYLLTCVVGLSEIMKHGQPGICARVNTRAGRAKKRPTGVAHVNNEPPWVAHTSSASLYRKGSEKASFRHQSSKIKSMRHQKNKSVLGPASSGIVKSGLNLTLGFGKVHESFGQLVPNECSFSSFHSIELIKRKDSNWEKASNDTESTDSLVLETDIPLPNETADVAAMFKSSFRSVFTPAPVKPNEGCCFARNLTRGDNFYIVLAAGFCDWSPLLNTLLTTYSDEDWRQATAKYLGVEPYTLRVQLEVCSVIVLNVVTLNRALSVEFLGEVGKSKSKLLAGLLVSSIRLVYVLRVSCTPRVLRTLQKWSRTDTYQGIMSCSTVTEITVDDRANTAATLIQAFLRACLLRRELVRMSNLTVEESETRITLVMAARRQLRFLWDQVCADVTRIFTGNEIERREWILEWEEEDRHFMRCRVMRATAWELSNMRSIVWYMEKCERLCLQQYNRAISIYMEWEQLMELYAKTTRLELSECLAAYVIHDKEFRQRLDISNKKRMATAVPNMSSKYRKSRACLRRVVSIMPLTATKRCSAISMFQKGNCVATPLVPHLNTRGPSFS